LFAQADTVANFIKDTKFNSAVFASVVKTFRVLVIRSQKIARGYLACRKAKMDILKTWWHDAERDWIRRWKLKKKVSEEENPAMVTPAPKRIRDSMILDRMNKEMRVFMGELAAHQRNVKENELQVGGGERSGRASERGERKSEASAREGSCWRAAPARE
jgi:hypothetical protein